MRNLFFSIVLIFAVSSCTSVSDLGRGKSGKSFSVQGNYTYDQVWQATLGGIQSTTGDQKLEIAKPLSVVSKDKEKGSILANSGMGLFSYGEVVGIFIDPQVNSSRYTIEVESRAKLKTNITNNNWEDEVIKSIKNQLKKNK